MFNMFMFTMTTVTKLYKTIYPILHSNALFRFLVILGIWYGFQALSIDTTYMSLEYILLTYNALSEPRM